MGKVRFGNDNFTAIIGYEDYVQGNLTICHVYYVEGLGHNLLSVEQFCDGDLEYNKTPNEILKGRKPNVQYFHVFGSLCYPTNDCDDLGKMRPKADIDNSAANTLYNEDTPSSSSIIVEDNDALQIVTSSEEQIEQEPSTLVLNSHSDGQIQKDNAELDGHTLMNIFRTPDFKEAESSSNYQDPSNMHEFHQKHRYTDKWTKSHPIEQVISDPSKPMTTRSKLHIDAELCMYALTVSLTEPKNIKEAMLDHSWIESMQDKLNQFK
ncbi:hypothetical protein Tco_0512592 [Tanacetum coccineum]